MCEYKGRKTRQASFKKLTVISLFHLCLLKKYKTTKVLNELILRTTTTTVFNRFVLCNLHQRLSTKACQNKSLHGKIKAFKKYHDTKIVNFYISLMYRLVLLFIYVHDWSTENRLMISVKRKLQFNSLISQK